jgi:hypothetical protein
MDAVATGKEKKWPFNPPSPMSTYSKSLSGVLSVVKHGSNAGVPSEMSERRQSLGLEIRA